MNWAPFFGRLWALFASRHRLEYETLIAMAEEISETDEEVKSVARSESCRMRSFTFNAWSVVSMVLLVILVGQWKSGSLCSNEESSLIWDLPQSDAPRSLTTFETRRFTSAIRDDIHGKLHLSSDPSEARYIGSPSPEIDENWDSLIQGRYFRLEDREVSKLQQDQRASALTEMPESDRIARAGFYGGPDVLHSLHCLNALRKHLDIEYYAESMSLPPEYRRMHIDHCVDHLRQALLCHGDLTPVTMKPVVANTSLPGQIVFYLGQTEREHTCRSTEAIRDWVTARGKRTGLIAPHNPQP